MKSGKHYVFGRIWAKITMANNRLKFWLSFGFIVLLYFAFMVYYCNAGPNSPNDITFENANNVNPADILNNSNSQKDPNIMAVLPQNAGHATTEIGAPGKAIGPEVYLCEITSFYERIITILSIVVGVILGLNFLYIHATSRRQAEDMAREALSEESFKIKMDKMVESQFLQSRDKGDINDLFVQLEEINEIVGNLKDTAEDAGKRIEFLEKTITKNSYNLGNQAVHDEGKIKNGDN